jgi:PleD family two-component response regulator
MLLFKYRNNNYSLTNSLKKKTNGKIYNEDEFRTIIERERARADRTDHQFSLIVLDLKITDRNQYNTKYILEEIFCRMRKIDEIGWYGQYRIGIILPYTTAQGAQKFAESLCKLVDPSMVECVFNLFTYGSDKNNPSELNQEKISKRA